MKKLLFVVSFFYLSYSFSQLNFKWDIKDTISKSKENLYSDNKIFIAEYWKSATDVIKNEDKNESLIILKGKTKQHMSVALNEYLAIFNYTVKFMCKENKYRIIIDNVDCEFVSVGGYTRNWPLLPVLDTIPVDCYMTTGLSEKKYLYMMSLLKTEIQRIADDYVVFIRKPSIYKDEEW